MYLNFTVTTLNIILHKSLYPTTLLSISFSMLFLFYTPPHDSGGHYSFTLVVRVSGRVSVRPSVIRPFVFSFPDDNLSECQWIFTELGMCIDIVEIWVGLANGQISSIFDSYQPATRLFLFPGNNE